MSSARKSKKKNRNGSPGEKAPAVDADPVIVEDIAPQSPVEVQLEEPTSRALVENGHDVPPTENGRVEEELNTAAPDPEQAVKDDEDADEVVFVEGEASPVKQEESPLNVDETESQQEPSAKLEEQHPVLQPVTSPAAETAIGTGVSDSLRRAADVVDAMTSEVAALETALENAQSHVKALTKELQGVNEDHAATKSAMEEAIASSAAALSAVNTANATAMAQAHAAHAAAMEQEMAAHEECRKMVEALTKELNETKEMLTTEHKTHEATKNALAGTKTALETTEAGLQAKLTATLAEHQAAAVSWSNDKSSLETAIAKLEERCATLDQDRIAATEHAGVVAAEAREALSSAQDTLSGHLDEEKAAHTATKEQLAEVKARVELLEKELDVHQAALLTASAELDEERAAHAATSSTVSEKQNGETAAFEAVQAKMAAEAKVMNDRLAQLNSIQKAVATARFDARLAAVEATGQAFALPDVLNVSNKELNRYYDFIKKAIPLPQHAGQEGTLERVSLDSYAFSLNLLADLIVLCKMINGYIGEKKDEAVATSPSMVGASP